MYVKCHNKTSLHTNQNNFNRFEASQDRVGSSGLSKTTVAMHNSSYPFQASIFSFTTELGAFGMLAPFLAQSARFSVFCPGGSYPGLCYLGAVARCSVVPREFPYPFLPIRATADATACNQPPHSLAQVPPHWKRVPSSSTLASGSPQDLFVF